MDPRALSLHSSASSGRMAGEAIRLDRLAASYHGWLYQRASGSLLRGWRRRFVVLSDERLYIFRDAAAAGYPVSVVDLTAFRSVQRASAPRRTKHGLVLRTARRPSVFDSHPAAHAPPPAAGELELYADCEVELQQWIGAVSAVFVSMDMRAFQSPLSSFDALVHRAGKLGAPGGSILNRLERQRGARRSPSVSAPPPMSPTTPTAFPVAADFMWR
ncbi:hypothetical protein IWQ57_005828 [Coemansia nantahalensis]|uniref:Uncharacterized protein n=2 Tax=Coemansia TaxID=4863 RepID=A0ACC1KVG7_9FUNG|nr:hypothetical protein IWQ57_005828 [Coemansia nantahalensis]KAJ2795366.1 hypothetical protein H4R21_005137 [Coemansia helicoidea]